MNKCPHIKSIKYVDFCKESERISGRIKPCLLMSGYICDEWDKIQEEWEAEYGDAIREWKEEQKGVGR